MVLLEYAFFKHDLNIKKISKIMEDILPDKYFSSTEDSKKEDLTSEALKKEIYLGGSMAYECLIDSLQKQISIEEDKHNIMEEENLENVLKILTNHISKDIKPLYRYVWIWSKDQNEMVKKGDILTAGKGWYTKKSDCFEAGLSTHSNYLCKLDRYLGVESVCSCLLHKSECNIDYYALPCDSEGRVIDNNFIEPPCTCFRSGLSFSMKYIDEALIEGQTIISTGAIYTHCDPTQHEYKIKETKEIFFSEEEELYFAFLERKRNQILKKITGIKGNDELIWEKYKHASIYIKKRGYYSAD